MARKVAVVLNLLHKIWLCGFHRLVHFIGRKCIICNKRAVCFVGKVFFCITTNNLSCQIAGNKKYSISRLTYTCSLK